VAVLARLFQFLFWLIVAAWLARKLFALVGGTAANLPADPPPEAPKALRRCSWCGTFVAPEISHILEETGRQYDFCCPECRQRFLEARRASVRPGQIGASA